MTKNKCPTCGCTKRQKSDKVEVCFKCKTQRAYSEKYDAYYCPKCLYWLEKICMDRKCEFCNKRPRYPVKGQK